ncbi:MAG: hypothetical protein C5B57_07625 [Blastocatellia bacterium]|nr:MAG: hypothetical protein C5B57_07625 [Blastocatellia bacterium]
MALLDRFRSVPANKHPDPEVRLAYIEALSIDEREQLATAAREDENARVRRAAVTKLMDANVLGLVAREDADVGVRAAAAAMLRDIALEAFEETGEAQSLAAVEALTDPKIIAQVAKTAQRESVAERALARVSDVRLRGSIARHAILERIRRAALDSLDDEAEITAVALNSEFKDTGVAAVERLTTRSEIEHVAVRSNNKNAAKRARGILREIDEQAGQADVLAASEPDDSAETLAMNARLEIVQRMEALASAEDLTSAEIAVQESEARWTLLATSSSPDPDIAARFETAVENLRRRAAEVRAIEADRQRAATEAARLQAADRAQAEAAAAEVAQKELERQRSRLLELALELETAASDEDLRAARRRATLVEREWRDLTATAAAAADLAARYEAAEARLVGRETEAKETEARLRREALNRLNQLLGRAETLAKSTDLTAKVAERALREVRATATAVPPLPSKSDFDEVVRRLKKAQADLTPKLQELRAIEDWQRWANVGIQEALCEKMEALKALENPEEIARRVRDLQQQWRQAADAPRAQGEALWRRFKAAHDEVWARCEAHFAAEAAKRAENLAKKIALCERAEVLAESTNWIQTAEEIKRLQAEWKTIGAIPRGQEKAVWQRFHVACDRFFTRRHDDLMRRKTMWAENLAKKEALCVKAEALADSTDWAAAAAEIKGLQAQWKTIGPVKKARSEAIWQRFRSACDRFFNRFAQRHEIARGERVAAREAICAELEALGSAAGGVNQSVAPDSSDSSSAEHPTFPPEELLSKVRALRSRWQQELAMRGVDLDRAAALDQRFAGAFATVVAAWPEIFKGTDLDPDANRQRMETLVHRLESLAESLGVPGTTGIDQSLSPTTKLAAMLKDALAANTIGGKVDEEARLRGAQDEVRQAQAGWSRIGPVPEPVRRALVERFNRASRRILERTSEAAKSGGSARTGRTERQRQ